MTILMIINLIGIFFSYIMCFSMGLMFKLKKRGRKIAKLMYFISVMICMIILIFLIILKNN
ncbi:ABC-type sugar transport system permease subunit [Lachnospiraceae bacterium PF1-22]